MNNISIELELEISQQEKIFDSSQNNQSIGKLISNYFKSIILPRS